MCFLKLGFPTTTPTQRRARPPASTHRLASRPLRSSGEIRGRSWRWSTSHATTAWARTGTFPKHLTTLTTLTNLPRDTDRRWNPAHKANNSRDSSAMSTPLASRPDTPTQWARGEITEVSALGRLKFTYKILYFTFYDSNSKFSQGTLDHSRLRRTR